MFFIPGFLISIVTFPGVIVHELAHQLFCRLCGVAVLDVCYFRLGNPAGYVVHEHPKDPRHEILIGMGPFFVNTVLGALVALPAAIPILNFDADASASGFGGMFALWLGVSIAMHAFPSTTDASNIWAAIKNEQTSMVIKVIATPAVGLIYLGALGSVFWLDLIYGVLVAVLIPNVIIGMLA